jgi:hypothetical protein
MKSIVHFSIALLTAFAATHVQASDLAISFISPTNGQIALSPLLLQTNPSESSNRVVSVEYFVDGQSVAVANNAVVVLPPTVNLARPAVSSSHAIFFPLTPFGLFWVLSPGDYVLTAKATDNQGNTAVSDPVNVTIEPTPVVTVEATAPFASLDGPGIFTLTRTVNTNRDLIVQFFLLGTAQNGVDYSEVSNSVTIPAGQASTNVVINPLIFAPGQTKMVILRLWDHLFPGGQDPGTMPQLLFEAPPYLVGSSGEAAISLRSSEPNPHKPWVKLVKPRKNHPSFSFGSGITITADAFDRDTFVAKVEFFDGTTKLGETAIASSTPPSQKASFEFSWTNAPVGPHVLHARATDSQNAVQVSAPVRIQVRPAP